MIGLGIPIIGGELLPKKTDILLDRVDQSSLVLLDSSPDLGSDEEGIEFGKCSEHLLSVSSCRKLVAESRNDLILDSGDSVVVSRLSSVPDLGALW